MNISYGAIDTRIVADCVSDVSTVSVQKIKYEKPDGTTGEWTATLGTGAITIGSVTYEANTYIYYDTLEDDIDQVGDWKVQAYVELSGGLKTHGFDNKGKGSWALMRVKENVI